MPQPWVLPLTHYDQWEPIAIVAGIFFLGQFLEGNFISPKLVGDRVGLNPVWMIFAILAGGAVAGLTGVLLAVPVAAILGVVIRFSFKEYRQAVK